MIVLGVMDLDLAFRVARPTELTEQSTVAERCEIEKWDRLNRMSLMIMKRVIPEAFRSTMFDQVTTTKEFLQEIEKQFAKNEKSEISTLLANIISMRYKGKRNIWEYIMEMPHLASKLKALKLELSEDLLMHLVLISLPTQFSQFKVSYNYQKDSWSLNELISHCVQEEEKIKWARTESAQMGANQQVQKEEQQEEEG